MKIHLLSKQLQGFISSIYLLKAFSGLASFKKGRLSNVLAPLFFLLFFLSSFPAFAQFPYEQDFKGNSAPGVIFGGTPTAFLTGGAGPVSGGVNDAVGNGYLRLTDNSPNQTGFVYSNRVFSGTYGLNVEFEYFTYGGTGADGICFFLFDAAVPDASFNIGGFGGSLGYALSGTTPGVSKGYLGIGLDEYGNFSNQTEGRQGGDGFFPDAIVLRNAGDGNQRASHMDGQNIVYDDNGDNYKFLIKNQVFNPANNTGFRIAGGSRTAQPGNAGYRKLFVNLAPRTGGGLVINVSIQHGAVIDNVITNYQYTTPVPAAGLKYGISSSTGGTNNFHEIRGLTLKVDPKFLQTPEAANFTKNICQGQPVIIDVLAGATTPNAGGAPNPASVNLDLVNHTNTDPLQTVVQPGIGTFVYDPNTTKLTFTPLLSFFGTTTLDYNFMDIYGAVSKKGTVTINVELPVITAQPASNTVCEGSSFTTSATVNAGVTGAQIAYQWQYFNTINNDWEPVNEPNASGQGTQSLTITNVPFIDNGRQYKVVMTTTGGCVVESLPATLTVNPTARVIKPADQTLCNQSSTGAINFTGNITGNTYSWTNDAISIGLQASGSGNIASFPAVNNSNAPVIAHIVVTPGSPHGCNVEPQTFTITVNPTPAAAAVNVPALCNGASQGIVTFSGTVAGTTYHWTKDATAIGLAVSSGDGDLPAFTAVNTTNAPISSTFTVTPTANGCEGTPMQFTIKVNPTPTVAAVNVPALCNGANQPIVVFSSPVAGTTYHWTRDATDIGLSATSGDGNLPAFTAVNTTNAPISSTFTVTPTANGCEGTPIQFIITVNPTPTVVPVSVPALCNGANQGIVAFSSPVAGATYHWTKDVTNIGLPLSSGDGNLPSFTAVNTTNAPVSSVITVTPTANGCEGTPIQFIITVNPTPTIAAVNVAALCNGANQPIVVFSGPVTGTTYHWTKDATDIGLPAASGDGNLPSFTAVNTTNASISSTFTVTPTANGCEGTPIQFIITVKPTPTVVAVNVPALCNGANQAIVNFSSTVTGTTFHWTKDATYIGLSATSGDGNLPSFTAVNSTSAPVSSTFTVTPTANGCEGTPMQFIITVNPTPTVVPVNVAAICNGVTRNSVVFSGPVTGTTYHWSKDATDIGLSAILGDGNLPSFTAVNTTNAPVSSVITVTPTANGCEGTPIQFIITVNPTPTVTTVNVPALCNGASRASIVFSGPVAGTTYHWTKDGTFIGLPATSGDGNVPAFTAVNTTNAPVSSTFTVTPTSNGCEGTPIQFIITVNPTPTVVPVNVAALCNGASQGIVAFSSPVTGATYHWTKDGTDIGLSAVSGDGNLPSFTAINTTNAPISSVITVTPTANGCEGTPIQFIITVNPTPTVVPVNVPALCNGATRNSVIFSSPVTGTTYHWTKDATDIGLPATSGDGNLPAFTAVNTTNAPVSSTFTVTPKANGCEGTPIEFIITVNPTPTVMPVSVAALCNGVNQASVTFSSPVAGATYHWTKDATDIGLPATSGDGNLPLFTAVNTTNGPVSTVITVTPTANGCEGTPMQFIITVNPTPSVVPVNIPALCNGANQASVIFNGPVTGTTYHWTKEGTDIGLSASSGNGNLPAFTAVNTANAPVSSIFTVTPTANGCEGTPMQFIITVNPTPTVVPVTVTALCNGATQNSVVFSSPVAGTIYHWTKDGTYIGLPGTSGDGNLPSFTAVNTTNAPVSSIFTVTPTANGCEGTPIRFTITVNPTATVAAVNVAALCNGANQASVIFSGPVTGTTYHWTKDATDIGLAVSSGDGNLPAFTAVNTTNAPIFSVVTVTPTANGCEGTPMQFIITVNPTPTVVPVNVAALCNGTTQNSVVFNSPVTGTTYHWTKDGTYIGLPATSGDGNLPSFTAVNTTNAPVSSTFTVTPKANGCEGTPIQFTITVNPTPTVVPVSVAALCNGVNQASITFSGPVTGTTYHWTKDAMDIGLPVSSGDGNLPAFTAVNTTTAPIFSVITVTPTANGCEGTPMQFIITVNPTPTVVPVSVPALCNGATQSSVVFNSPVTGTTYHWTKDATDIGLPAVSGDGNLPSFTAVNTTNAPISSIFTVTPKANGCEGTPIQFTITVNPTPTVVPVSIAALCNGVNQASVTFSSPVAGTTYHWTKDATDIGLAVSSGDGNLPAFTGVNTTNAPISSTFTVAPTANGCEGTPMQFIITVNPTPTVVPVSVPAICNGAAQSSVVFNSPVTGATYHWTKDATAIGLPANSGDGNLPSFTAVNTTSAPISSVITVTPTANGCEGTPIQFTITVNPTATVTAVNVAALCNGANQASIIFSSPVAGATYHWTKDATDIGLAVSSGDGNLPAFTAVNTTNAPVSSTFTVTPTANGCEGTPMQFIIIVNPTPTVVAVNVPALCNGTSQVSVIFSGPVAGTTYHWTKDATDIGLAVSSGDGNLPAFTAVNTTNAPVSSVITVTPKANSCEGTPIQFTITVNPTSTIAAVNITPLCNGASQAGVTFSGPVAGTTYHWSTDGTDIGLPATSGDGNLPAFTAVNTTNAPVSSVITVTPTANGCEGTPMQFVITVNPTPTVAAINVAALCNGANQGIVIFSGPVAGTTYRWTKDATDIGLALSSGNSNLPSFTAVNTTNAPISSTFTVIPKANGCEGTPIQFTITVNPTPTVAAVHVAALCNGATQSSVAFNGPVAGTTYHWTKDATEIGLPVSSGDGNLPAFTAVNTTNAPLTSIFTVTPTANGCEGTPIEFTITVNPTPTVVPVNVPALCNGANQAIVVFSSPVAGTTYHWTKDAAAIGLTDASGDGNLPSFTAVNTTNAPVSSVITVTPSVNGCEGTPIQFTITVNPTPTVVPVSVAALCNGASQASVIFSGPVAGTTYHWSKDVTDIGLPVSSGDGNLPAFTAVNTTNAPVSSVITVTPAANGCEGTPIEFIIKVNPTPTVVPVNVAALCNGANQAGIVFSGPVTGTTYHWTKDATDIGLPGSLGNGNLPAFTAVNTTNAPISSTFTVTPAANGCEGTPMQFTITVNPTPTVVPVSVPALCNGASQVSVIFSGPVAGTTYHWTKDATDIGLAVSSGDGNLPAFTAVNTTNAPIFSVVTVTPTANGCEGTPMQFIITVNPTPTVVPVNVPALCNEVTRNSVVFSSPVTGATYHWTKDATDIGLPASSGDGDLPSFTAVNTTNAPISSTFTVTPAANGCEGTPIQFTITVNPTPIVVPVSVPALCNGATQSSVIFNGPVAGTTYHWSKDATDIGLAISSGDGNLPAFTAVNTTNAPISSVIIVTPTANGCEGTPMQFIITVNPTPAVVPVNIPALCNGATQNSVVFSSPVTGATYHWTKDATDIGLPAVSGDGDLPSFTAVNTTNAPISSTFTVTPTANGCEGIPMQFTITVNPTPTIVPVSVPALCNGATLNSVIFTSPVAGTTYHWTKDATDIGLAVSSGDGNLPAFTAVNTTYAPISSTFTVTPTANGCEGTPMQFTITVNPTPTVVSVNVPALCNGATWNSVVFSSSVTGTTYHWTKDATDIGLPVSSGDGNLPSFTAVNTTNAPISSVITVTPKANGCEGTPMQFTITVNPTPTVVAVNVPALCNGATQNSVVFSSPVAGTIYHWTKDATDIGLPVSSGDGNLPAFTAVNTTNAPISSTFTVTPTANGCEGTPMQFIITVNPTPTVLPVSIAALCNGANQDIVIFSSPVAGTTYHWTKDATDIGLPVSSGDGNLPSFTAVNTTSAPISSVITVTPKANGCEGTPIEFAITVNPTPTVVPVNVPALCNGANQAIVVFNGPVTGTTYHWSKDGTDIGLPVSSGDGNLPAFTAVNTTNVPISSTFTITPIANGCEGIPIQFIITVKPTPTAITVNVPALCNGANQAVIVFSGPVTGTTYHWTKDGINIGLPVSSGDGNLPAFTAVNTTNAPISSVIMVTPKANGCEGTPMQFTITVNPTPAVLPVSVDALCNGVNQASVVFSSPVAGTTYHWTKDATDIGLPVSSGDGNLPAFTAVNTTNVPISSTFTVTPKANGCEGTPIRFTITVNPTPTVVPVSVAALCNGANQAGIVFSSPVAGTTYHWTKDGINIGLSVSSGDGNLPAFIAVNTTDAPLTSTFTVTPKANGCEGIPMQFTITVNPDAAIHLTSVAATANQADCINNNITVITYQITNATRVEATGLPADVTGTFANGVFTISGAPSVLGTFHYTVTATGICRMAQLSGTITVNPRPAGYNDIISNLSCGNTAISYNLQDNINNTARGGNAVPSTFTWTAVPNRNVTGVTNGSGNAISATLYNLSQSVQQVVYTVTPTSTLGGCPGQTFTVTVNVPVCSGVTITKTADVNVVSQAGDLIRYTITVKNIATANHTGVKVTDPFLGGILTGPASGDNGNGILEANESWVYTGTYRVTQADVDNNGKPNAGTGKIINTATVNTIEHPELLSASSSVDIVTTGDITLVKEGILSRDFSTITYTFTVTNTGKVRLHNLNLMDPKMGGRINLNPDVLEAGASVSTTVIYTVTDAEKRDGQVINTATVTGATPAGDAVTDISGTQANNNTPTVNIIDDAPQAINDNASTPINQPVTFSLTDNDLPSFNGLDRGSIIITKFPANGIVQVNPDGTVTYTPNRTYSGPDSFMYTITDLKGKVSNKALVSITVIPIDLFIPNTFTPNGDGKNDTFRIIGRESFDSLDLLIFNRWGNEVYRRNNYLDDWDGSGLNEGTYYYLITLKKGGNEIVKKGWILLKR